MQASSQAVLPVTHHVVDRNEVHAGVNYPVRIDVKAQGTGPLVVILPSLGRDSDEFDPIAAHLAYAGYRVLRPAPRGIAGSIGPEQDVSLHDLAADVLAVIDHEQAGPAVLAGHAFGNWIARVAAVDRPDRVRAVIILAAGPRKVAPAAIEGLEHCLNLALPDDQRLNWLQTTFFAKDNDASVWLHGWYPEAARLQRAAKAITPIEQWWAAGGVPLLDVWASEDAFAPEGSGWRLSDDLGDQVTTVRVAGAGHALIPEQPAAVAEAIVDYLKQLPQQLT
jgi:pimeloyl-ACP methyl ester carboxylesterase